MEHICINSRGLRYIRFELDLIGLTHWDHVATAAEIEQKATFDDEMTDNGRFEYEITNSDMKTAGIGSGGYGVYRYLTIERDHCDFEPIDESNQ